MWFEKRRDRVSEEKQPQHWPTERMIAEGHADYATSEDLEGASPRRLLDIAQICEVDTYAPDECIPCKAAVMFLEQEEEKNAPEPEVPDYEPEERPTPALDEMVAESPPWDDADDQPYGKRVSDARHADPMREVARQAGYLQQLIEEALDGPPIPPRNVSEEELALLVVGAQRWIKITEAQGVELAPAQQQILNATKTLVERLHRG